MSRRLLSILALILMLSASARLTATAQDYDNEVLTMFTRGTIDFPKGKISAALSEVNFTPPQIGQVIAANAFRKAGVVLYPLGIYRLTAD